MNGFAEYADKTKARQELRCLVADFLAKRSRVKVLEAGCGSASRINLPSDAYIVGIDISEEQLEKNQIVHAKILGDIQRYTLPACEYDLIICWNVLEHLQHPELALRNFANSVKTDGIIVLALPNVCSVVGLITKLTPYRFHIWAKRLILGDRRQGRQARQHFPTHLSFSISPNAIERYAKVNGLRAEYSSVYDPGLAKALRVSHPLLGRVFGLFCRCVRVLSLNQIQADRCAYVVVLRKAARATTSLDSSAEEER